MAKSSSLKNKKILLTCGPTWVPIDDVRVISNVSTGRLGFLLAEQLHKKGAKVCVLCGPSTEGLRPRPKLSVIPFKYFDQLAGLLHREAGKEYDAIIHAAAVSDFQVKKPYPRKIESTAKNLSLTLVPTPKLITKLKHRAPRTKLIGFKLGSGLPESRLKDSALKVARKAKCDFIVANQFVRTLI